jgi:hypothetical protein
MGIILGFLLIISCTQRVNNSNQSVDYKDYLKTKGIDIKDFKFDNSKDFGGFEYEASGFKELKDTNLINEWFGKSYHLAFNIYLYSIQKPIGQILPLTFIQTGADYAAIVLKLIDFSDGKVIQTYELSGGECGGPGELGDNIWSLCGKNTSVFQNDSLIRNTKVKFYCDSLSEESDMRVDTIKYLLTIDRIKGLQSKQIDSIRINTKEKNYVR